MGTMNEDILDASVRHQVKVLRFTKAETNRAIKLLEASDAEIVAKLQAGPTEWSEAHLRKTLEAIRRQRVALVESLKKQVQEQAEAFALNEATWELDAIAATSPVTLQLAGVAPAVLQQVARSPINGVPLDGWLGQMAQSDMNRIEQAMRLGILQGETKQQMVKRVQSAVELTRQHASTIVRTSYNHVSNAAKQEVWTANADILEGVRWSAVLDGRTSPVCRSRDGTVYPVDSGPRPPAHPNCRSQVVPVVKGEKVVGERPMVRDSRTRKEREKDFRAEAKAKAGAAWKDLSPAQRNALVASHRKAWIAENVGTVPSTTNYDAWLRKQPKAFQDDVLGPGRAKLFRDGMTLDKFVDESGKQYTLAELVAETKADALNVVQPGIGMKAKSLLQQGFSNEDALAILKKEFPDASPTLASMASYKSELKKAGLVGPGVAPATSFLKSWATSVPMLENIVESVESSLPAGVKHHLGGQWLTLADELVGGAPGAYAYYQAGKGVTASIQKLSSIPVGQSAQVLAHELGHLLHKQHDVLLPPDVLASLKVAASNLSPYDKKVYSYYLAHPDELVAEIYAQALSPSPYTSQGLVATGFKEAFGPAIQAAKVALQEKFPAPGTGVKPLLSGAPTAAFEVAGKHASIGSLAKALLQQGMPDDQVLAAVKAEFPSAKTGMASIKSYKSQLKAQKKLANGSGPTVVAKDHAPSKMSPAPPPPITAAATKGKGAESDELSAILDVPEAAFKAPAGKVKQVGVQLMKAGVLDNNEILAALAKLYPHNKVTPASVATWKSVWKKAHPTEFQKAKAKHVKLDLIAEQAGPTKLPFLYNKSLGFKSNQVLNDAKAKLAAGASTSEVEAFIVKEFGGPGNAKPQGVANLLELAIYEVNTAKAINKPYLNSIAGYKSPAAAALDQPTIAKGKVLNPGWSFLSADELGDFMDGVSANPSNNSIGSIFQAAAQQKKMIDPDALQQWLMKEDLWGDSWSTGFHGAALNHWKLLPDAPASGKLPKFKAPNLKGPVDMTPARPASSPYDGRPPPPRFSAQQRAAALKQLSGEARSVDWANKVNARYNLTGDNAVTPEEIGIIRSYTGNKTYARVNEALRNGKYASQPVIQAYVDAAQHGLSKIPPYVGPVTRGVRWLPHGMSMDQFLSRYQVGTVVEEHSFLSTARGTSAVYHGPVYFKINSKTGRDVDWFSKFSGNEREVLMMPGTRLHITKVEKDPMGKWIIHADEVVP